MDHRARDCDCAACVALGRVAAVVVDEDTSDSLRSYVAKTLERAYTKILEKGLELLRQERRATEGETSGAGCHPAPGDEAEEHKEEVKDTKEEPEQVATKKRRRKKKKPQPEEEAILEEEDNPVPEGELAKPVETPGIETANETPAPSASEEVDKRPVDRDHRSPLPRKPVKPSSKPSEPAKERKAKDERGVEEAENPRFVLKPKARPLRRTSRSRSRNRQQKDKKKRRSPSPESSHRGGDQEISSRTTGEEARASTEVDRPPGNWEEVDQVEGDLDLRIIHLPYLADRVEASCGLDLSVPTRTDQRPRRRTRASRKS